MLVVAVMCPSDVRNTSSRRTLMSAHLSAAGSPSLSPSSANPECLSSLTSAGIPPSTFYSTSPGNRPVTPPQIAPNSTSTPIANKISGSYTYASGTHYRDSVNYRLALETSGLFLGAMPPKQFLDEFLPLSQDAPKCPDSRTAFAEVGSAGKEVDMYGPFVSMVFVSVSASFLHSTFDRSQQQRPSPPN